MNRSDFGMSLMDTRMLLRTRRDDTPSYRKKYGYVATDFPVAFSNFERLLSLPLHPGLTDQDVSDVIDAVLDVVQIYRR